VHRGRVVLDPARRRNGARHVRKGCKHTGKIKGLSLLEAAQLVKEMESAFGVTAAAPMMMAGGGAPAARCRSR